jgi:hypothetical protein
MDYYIYHHVDPRTNKAMYVGLGQYDRAWNVRSNQRSEHHVKWLEELYSLGYTLSDIVSITENRLTKLEAKAIEKEQINLLKPAFNKLMNSNHWQKGRKFSIEMCEFAKGLKDMGYSYKNIAYLVGSPNPINNVMSTKRMVQYVSN